MSCPEHGRDAQVDELEGRALRTTDLEGATNGVASALGAG